MLRSPHVRLRPSQATARAGFTLVEMLVATALVVLMLVLFAQIFGDTVRIMRNQQALSQNDQKARAVDTVLRTDFEKATFRQVRDKGVYGITPLRANWPVDAERQRGYFYISENDPEDPTDDVLQFTIDMRLTHRNPEISVLRGKATNIAGADNEPENDDGIAGNFMGESPAAEVSYFLRGGNLYRRVNLLRKPKVPTATGAPTEYPMQPGSGADGAALIFQGTGNPLYTAGTTRFWDDFDYSAWLRPQDINPPDGTDDTFQIVFNGVDTLQNVAGATSFPIAVPWFRFGHRPALSTGGTRIGFPVEHLLNADTAVGFLGRFTHEETSSPAFVWPGGFPAPLTAHPLLRTNYTATNLASVSQIVTDYELGERAGEDLLLSGVESFDLEVWDDGFHEEDYNRDGLADVDLDATNGVTSLPGQWVSLGHDSYHPSSGQTDNLSRLGWFRQSVGGTYQNQSFANANPYYGSRIPANATDYVNQVFDTWHPAIPAVGTNTGLPPFCPRAIALPPVGTSQLTIVGRPSWAAGANVTYNTIFFPRVANPASLTVSDDDSYYYRPIFVSEDANNNFTLDSGEDANSTSTLDGPTGDRQPEWPREPGATVVDGGVIWQCFDNRIGLQAVRVTIRFRDPKIDSPRQVSIVHSFVE